MIYKEIQAEKQAPLYNIDFSFIILRTLIKYQLLYGNFGLLGKYLKKKTISVYAGEKIKNELTLSKWNYIITILGCH